MNKKAVIHKEDPIMIQVKDNQSIERPLIHAYTSIHPNARLAADVRVDPFTMIHHNVEIGAGTWIGSNVTIMEGARIGKNCRIYPGAVVAADPQDLKFDGEETTVVIGDNTTIREFVTIHRGTAGGGMLTRVGDDCLIMAQAHIAHDCLIGDGVIMANAATLAGHVIIEDRANVGAYSGIHQFCRVGKEAYIGGYSVVVKDALPFALTVGNHAKCYGLNTVGMKRRGYSREAMDHLHHAFHLLLSAKLNTTQAIERIKEEISDSSEVTDLLTFIEASTRGVTK